MSLPLTQEMLDRCSEIDTSERENAYVLTLPSGAYLRLSPGVLQLLKWRANGLTSDQIAASVAGRGDATLTVENIDAAYAKIDDRIRHIEENFEPKMFGLWMRLPLLPQAVVSAGAKRLTWAFDGILPLVLLGVIAASMVYVTFARVPVSHLSTSYFVGFGLFVLTLLAHEFGHAAACARFGAEPGEIGFALYLIFPAFYANVTSVWRLRRWERVVVDAAGMYFQLVVGAAYALIYMATGWAPCRIAALATATNCLFMLNPIFKFDGYWLLADALGVTNLGKQSGRILNALRARLRGQDFVPLPWPRSVTFILSIYSSIALSGWFLFLVLVLPRMWRNFLSGYPAMVRQFATDALESPSSISASRTQSLLAATFVAFIASLALWRFVSKFFGSVVFPVGRRLFESKSRAATPHGEIT